MTFIDLKDSVASQQASENDAGPLPDQRDPALVIYWRAALRWKWVILGIVSVALLAGLLVTLLMPPAYSASTRIEINRPQDAVANVRGANDDRAVDLRIYQTQYGLLRARSLAQRVVRSINLANNPQFFETFGADANGAMALEGGQNAKGQGQQLRIERAEEILLRHVSIAPVRGSSLVDIVVTSPDPALSARIANEWGRQFIESSIARRFASSADARRFLESRLQELRVRLEQSERDLVSYAADRQIITLRTSEEAGRTRTEQTLTAVDLEAINRSLAEATAARIAAESRARARSGGGSSAAALSNSAINALRQRRAELAAEYQRLMVQFEPEYPTARQLQAQIRQLEQAISTEESRVQGSYTLEYQQAVQRESALRARVDALMARMTDQQRDSIQYNIFQREVDTNRELYNALLQRYKEIGVAGVGLNNVAVVDPAQVPDSPSSPNLILNLLFAFVGGTVVAAGAVFALHQVDEGLNEPGEVSRLLGIPLLGTAPAVDPETVDASLLDGKSALFESYYAIYTNLAFSTDHGFPKSLSITSTRPGEAKSTTSMALALILARSGRRVALVDGDMRSPSLHQHISLSNEVGLSNYLAGQDDAGALLQESGQANLYVLTAGPQPPNAAELLNGERLAKLLESLGREFDHVIVDSPPVLGLADAPIIGSAVEAIAFTVEANGARVRGICASIARLASTNSHVLGAILTKFNDRNMFGYGYGYEYGYGYGKSAKS